MKMIGLIKATALAGLLIATALAGSAIAQDRARPRTLATPPMEVQPGSVGDTARIDEKCTGAGRHRSCKYYLVCFNGLLAGTYNSYADAFTANWSECPPRANLLVPEASDPGQPTTRDPRSLQAAPRSSAQPRRGFAPGPSEPAVNTPDPGEPIPGLTVRGGNRPPTGLA